MKARIQNRSIERSRKEVYVKIVEYFPDINRVSVQIITADGIGRVLTDPDGTPRRVLLGYRSDVSESLAISSGDFGYIVYDGPYMHSGRVFVSGRDTGDPEAYTYRKIGGGLALR